MSRSVSQSDSKSSQMYSAYGQIAEEFEQARVGGRQPDFRKILQEHPDCEAQIEQMIPTIGMLYAVTDNENDAAAESNEAANTQPPKELGDFRIVKEIGRGGMGVVYQAEQISLERSVALKVLPLAAFLDERQLQRFKNEARAAALLKHPHIVDIYAVGCERSVHFYAMELIDGYDLSELIDQRIEKAPGIDANTDTTPLAQLSTANGSVDAYRSVARIGSQAAEALHFAHEQGVVHRDIKPANLLLDRNADVHITDFGLARLHSGDGLTMSGDLVGTLRYVSPERIDGSRPGDPLGDIYSLGLTLYELIAGRPAFPNLPRQQLVKAILDTEPTSLRRIDPKVPVDLETIIAKAISKEPGDRYRTAQAFAEDLNRFLSHRPISARPVSAVTRASRFAKRNPVVTALLAVSTVLFGLLALGSVAAARQYATVADERNAEAERRTLELRDRTMEVYARDIRLAQSAIEDGGFLEGERLLMKWVPQEDQEDQRGIEWYHLWARKNDPTIIRSIHDTFGPRDVVFTPDGNLLDSYMRLCDLHKPRTAPMEKLESWPRYASELHFHSPYLFAATESGAVWIRNWHELRHQGDELAKSKPILLDFDNAKKSISSMDTDSTGKYLAIGAHGYSNASHVEVHRIDALDRISLQFGHDSNDGFPFVHFDELGNLVVLYNRSNVARVFELESQSLLHTYQLDGTPTSSCVFPDRKRIALALERKRGPDDSEHWIEVRDVSDWSSRRLLALPGAAAGAIHLSRNGRQLVAGDKRGKLWKIDVESGAVESRQLHDGTIYSVQVAADGAAIATTGADSFVHLVESDFSIGRNSAIVTPEIENQEGAMGTAFLDDRRVGISRGAQFVDIWDATNGKRIDTLELEPGFGDWVRLQADVTHHRLVAFQMQFAAGRRYTTPGRVTVWDTRTLERTHQFDIPNGLLTVSIGFSPDGRFLAVPGHRWLHLIDLQTRTVRTKEFPSGTLFCCSYATDGKTLACSAKDGTIYLLDPSSLRPIREPLIGDSVKQDCVVFIPKINLLAVVGGENRLKILDPKTGKTVRSSERFPCMFFTVAASHDGTRLAVGGAGGKYRVFRTADCQELIQFPIHRHFCFADFSPNGQSLSIAAHREAYVIHGLEMDRLKQLSVAELRESYCGQNQAK